MTLISTNQQPHTYNIPTIAKRLAQRGISVVPISPQTKRPLIQWKALQSAILSADQIDRHFGPDYMGRACHALAVIGGRVSGGLEIIDFDDPAFYDLWLAEVENCANGLPLYRTGRGLQVAYRRPTPGHNQKLAAVSDASQTAGWRVTIETRGEGGYAIVPPSWHEKAQRRYETLNGIDIADVPAISDDAAEFLLNVARELNQVPDLGQRVRKVMHDLSPRVAARKPIANPSTATGKIVDAFNAHNGLRDVLSLKGYTVNGDDVTRPGKDPRDGNSGHIVRCKDGRERYVTFSTNDPLNAGDFGSGSTPCGVADAFDVIVAYEHGGDFVAAVRETARAMGIHHRPDREILELIDASPDAEEFAKLFTGDVAATEGDIDAACERMLSILSKHTRNTEQALRLLARSVPGQLVAESDEGGNA